MNKSDPAMIIGRVLYQVAKVDFMPYVDEGATFILKGFNPDVLVGFAASADADSEYSRKLAIQYPRSTMVGQHIAEKFLSDNSAVLIRSSDYGTKVVFTNDLEPDVAESLGNKSSFSHDSLTEAAHAQDEWCNVLNEVSDADFPESEFPKLKAFIRSILQQSDISLTAICIYLLKVFVSAKDKPLEKAAGLHLPLLGIPLYENCFLSVKNPKYYSQWEQALAKHRKNESLLSKRESKTFNPIDIEDLESKLDEQLHLEEGDVKRLPDPVLNSFKDYIEADGRTKATEDFFFKNDWGIVGTLFETKKTSSSDFANDTRQALEDEGVVITDHIEEILDELRKKGRKSGGAPTHIKEFYARHRQDIHAYSKPRLARDWEDYVVGSKVKCTDFYDGLIQCLSRFHKALDSKNPMQLQIAGVRQGKANDFKGINREVGDFFERHYGDIETFFDGLIILSPKLKDKSLLFRYSKEIDEKIIKAKKSTNSQKNNKEFEFQIMLKEMGSKGAILSSVNLVWALPKTSVLRREQADFDSIASAKSPMVQCEAAYESIGKKGSPQPLDLKDMASFSGTKRNGFFVPALAKVKYISKTILTYIEEETAKENIPSGDKETLADALEEFESKYRFSLTKIAKRRTNIDTIPAMMAAYKSLVKILYQLPNKTIRKRCMRHLFQVGTVEIEKDNGRPHAAVVCPWHPLRLEASSNRLIQIKNLFKKTLSTGVTSFSDGASGALFFDDFRQVATGQQSPEVALAWDTLQPIALFCEAQLGGYSIHSPSEKPQQRSPVEDSTEDLNTLVHELETYLKLQPHERDNLSVLLYNCNSRDLPHKLAGKLARMNEALDSKHQAPINCEIFISNEEQSRLHDVYKSLVLDQESDDEDMTSEDFLSKVRINISASGEGPTRGFGGKSSNVDIVYGKDLLSSKASLDWISVQKHVYPGDKLYMHRWNKSVPSTTGDDTSKLLLCCPAQTISTWGYLTSIGSLFGPAIPLEWDADNAYLPIKQLAYDNPVVSKALELCHKWGTWVINSDALLDRRILEQRSIQVIRYVQNLHQGRNLVVSSTSNDMLLRVSIQDRLRLLMPGISDQDLEKACDRFVAEANSVTGGLVLRAARRANNTSELLGVVLSKYLIECELNKDRPKCWCSLDDYSKWLGKPSGDNLADLLVLCPDYRDGKPHLDIVVTEAKFVAPESLSEHKKKSAKQLRDTVSLISRALAVESPIDQPIWITRLSDLILSRLVGSGGKDKYSAERWRDFVRNYECSISIWGYSHVFIQADDGVSSSCKGIELDELDVSAQQEVFCSSDTTLISKYFLANDSSKVQDRRLQIGHIGFGPYPTRQLKYTEPEESLESIIELAGEDIEETPMQAVDKVAKEGESKTARVEFPTALPDNILDFLKARSLAVQSAETYDDWLNETVKKLRNAMSNKGMSSKLSEGRPPSLTPNAAIITFKGDPDLTQKKIEESTPEILTTYGLNILRISPGPGFLSVYIARPERQVVYLTKVLYDILEDSKFNPTSESIAVGLREEDGRPQFLDPFNEPHTLVSGATNSGKSVLIQCMLLYIGLTRKPTETQIFLVDGKHGVDYSALKELPHLKAGSGNIVVNKEESRALLEDMVKIMNRRYELFEKSGTQNIKSYRAKTGESLPTIFYVQDEFADWMLDKEYNEAITQSVNSLSIKSRAAGIFMIFGLQRPDNTVMPMQLRAQLSNRLTLKVADTGTAEIAMGGEKNTKAEQLLGKGHMLAKLEGKIIPVQVPYADPFQDIEPLVERLKKKYLDS